MTVLTRLRQLAARARAFVKRDHLDREFDDELESHLQMLSDENVRRGMSPKEARRAARLRLGAPASLAEQHRDARGLPGLGSILQDLRFAFRLLAKDRWYSAAAIAALALGIGANAAGFTIVNAAFLRGLPYEDADRLLVLSWQARSGRRSNVSYSDFQDWRAASRSFEALAAHREGTANISDDRGVPEQVSGTWLTANAFNILGPRPILGRDFTTDDERVEASPVVIISSALWQRRYSGDPDVLGRVLRLNGRPATIIGVMPEGMRFPTDTDVWTPYIPAEGDLQRNTRTLRVFGRLADGADRRLAGTEMHGLAQQLIAAFPDTTTDLLGVRVETFTERFIGGAGRSMFLTVMGAVVLVLLIACANVANLMLSRSTARAQEIAVRMAIGATRWRVVRQLLLESLVLSVIGGSIGLLLASAGSRAFAMAMQTGGLPYWVVFDVDYVVFLYAAAICVLTAMLFGLAPALHVSGTSPRHVLNEGGRSSAGSPRVRRFATAMVLTELALTTTLLVGAGLMIRSFMTLASADLGFALDGLTTMRVRLPDSKYGTPDARRAFFDRLEPRLRAIPGVEAAAITNGVPPHDGGERLLEIDLPRESAGTAPVFVGTVTITPEFFAVLRAPLIRGRSFTGADGAPGLETVVVNQRLAAQFFPGADPIGRRIRFTQRTPAANRPPETWRTIVGIVAPIKHGSPQDGYDNAVVYIPYRQETPGTASLLVRSTLPPESIVDAVRHEVQGIDPDQPVLSIQTLAQVLAETRWWWRTWGTLFGVLAAVALALSALGLYAVIAYSVVQRTREIGVRMALGASRTGVCWMILRRAVAQLVVGLAFGVAGAFVLSEVLWGSGMVVVPASDPLTYLAIIVLLSTVALTASLVPARRATRIDPVVALRLD
jgi:putative ABC transport system permease protein